MSESESPVAEGRTSLRRLTMALAVAILTVIWLIVRPTNRSDSEQVAEKIKQCTQEAQHEHMAAGEIQKIAGACADLHRASGGTYR